MDLSSIFNNPELMQALSESGVFDDEQNMLGQQMKRADALRMTPGAQGREVGRTYVASSPLEHLAVGLQRAQGVRGVADATTAQGGAISRARANAVALANALRGGAKPPQPPPAPQSFPPGIYPGQT